MKLQANELPLGKPQTRRRTPKIAPLIALTFLVTIIPIYYPTLRDSQKKILESLPSYESLEDTIRPISQDVDPPLEQEVKILPCSLNFDASVCNMNGADLTSIVPTRTNTDVEAIQTNDHHDETKVTSLREKKPKNPPTTSSRNTRKVKEPSNTRRRPDRRQAQKRTRRVKSEFTTNHDDRTTLRMKVIDDEYCDLFSGEWVWNPEGPYYTNATCNAIQEHQNCLKFGRPDRGFLKWRWKPDGCELPIFDPHQFLELVRGKSLAFVGDSVARNHMQSLICLLSKVVYPIDHSDILDQNRRYEYIDYNFNISMFWSPYLVRTEKTVPNDVTRPFKLFLDEFDDEWTSKIENYDYVIISAGHWFFRPTYFYLNGRLVSCLYCPEPEISHQTSYFSYRRAFRTVFRAITSAKNYKGVTFLRSFAPSHFENGPWDKGGDCARTKPFKRNETVLEDYSLEMYLIQLEELRIAQQLGRKRGMKFRLFDATQPMLLRPDGHPSKYGHWPVPNVTMANDCVHWCLPGPIDSWNDFLQEMLIREAADDRSTVM